MDVESSTDAKDEEKISPVADLKSAAPSISQEAPYDENVCLAAFMSRLRCS